MKFLVNGIYNPPGIVNPHVHHSMFGRCAFSVARPTVWNSLPADLCDLAVDSKHFMQNLKTHSFARYFKVFAHQRWLYYRHLGTYLQKVGSIFTALRYTT